MNDRESNFRFPVARAFSCEVISQNLPPKFVAATAGARNPAKQLRLVVITIIYKVL